jgi:nucleoporin NUP82
VTRNPKTRQYAVGTVGASCSEFSSLIDAMDSDNDWSTILTDHPIFSLPKPFSGPAAKPRSSLELSSNTLPDFTNVKEDSETPSGRRQVMLLKGADLILAAGKEIRMASLNDARLNQGAAKTYKVSLLCFITRPAC